MSLTKSEILNKLQVQFPVVCAPMFLISNIQMLKSCSASGIIGAIPSLNFRTSAQFDEALSTLNEHRLKMAIKTSYGVNLIVHRTNPRLQEDLSICIKHQVPLVITSLGAVKEVVDTLHDQETLVFHDVATHRHAEKAIEAGVDGLILVCAGAGGHAGLLNPFAFVSEVRKMFDGIILLAGSISDGQQIAAALQMGADLAYMGTRFINTSESNAPAEYKQMIVDARTPDVIYTAAVSGIPANFLKQSLDRAGLTGDLLTKTTKVNLGEELNTESKAWKSIWSAGHGVSNINDNPSIAELVSRLRLEYKDAINNQSTYL